jgi:hypothetical protein
MALRLTIKCLDSTSEKLALLWPWRKQSHPGYSNGALGVNPISIKLFPDLWTGLISRTVQPVRVWPP